jgi:hypothetical protein
MCDSAWKTGRPTKDGWYCIRIWLEHSEQFSDPTIWEWCRDKFISRHHMPVRFDYDVDQWCEIPLPGEKSEMQERLEAAEALICEFEDNPCSRDCRNYGADRVSIKSYRYKYPRIKGDSNDSSP